MPTTPATWDPREVGTLIKSHLPDYYGVLGIPKTASPSDIKKAYRTLAARYHPDKHKGNELEDLAREKLAALNEAYETLSDPARRAAYDAAFSGQGPIPFSGAPGGPPGASGGVASALVRMLIILGIAFYTFRFLRSPRAIVIAAVVILILWFGPRLLRKLRSGK
jgi:curved DNA-binding protein CbpA